MTETKTVTGRHRPSNGKASEAAGDGLAIRGGRPLRPGRRHILDLDDFSRDEIEGVFQNADAMA